MSVSKGALRATAVAVIAAGLSAPSARAEFPVTNTFSLFGMPGLLEMPSAETLEDGMIAGTVGRIGQQNRTTLTFQIAPRLTGAFRYSVLQEFETDGTDRFDRSFDLQYLLLKEAQWWPAIAVGLRDFVGTGVYSSEYLVATKSITPKIRLTAGLGWGRLATSDPILNENAERSTEFTQTGGTARFDQFFQGPISAFGGVSWDFTDKLSFTAEYSSDAYEVETRRGTIDIQTPWNYGLSYTPFEGMTVNASYLYGDTFGLQATFFLNPRVRPLGPGAEPASLPVLRRPNRRTEPDAWLTGWATSPNSVAQLRSALSQTLEGEGITLEGLAVTANSVEVRIENTRYSAQSQAIGRTARILARLVPASAETLVIVPVVDGVPSSAVSLQRSDLESLSTAPGLEMVRRLDVSSGHRPVTVDKVRPVPKLYPDLSWALTPYTSLSLFDPDSPVRAEVGAQLNVELALARGLIFSTRLRQPLVTNLDEITRRSNSVLPRVRSNFANFLAETDLRVERMHLAYFNRPAENLYGRITAGIFERMYAGVSSELLWKRPDSRLALGAELNYVRQREFDGGFGLRDYGISTGFLSAYYEIDRGYTAQVDVGQYLAGDVGATFSFTRRFDNGWRIGAFATLTDVPFEDFGEGSFDKGITIEMPLDYLSGQPSRRREFLTIRPLTRDGGARVFVDGRLYERVRDTHQPVLEARGGRFWK